MFDKNTKSILLECLNRQIRLYEAAPAGGGPAGTPTGSSSPTPTGGPAGACTASPTGACSWTPPTPDQIRGGAGGPATPLNRPSTSTNGMPSGLGGPGVIPGGINVTNVGGTPVATNTGATAIPYSKNAGVGLNAPGTANALEFKSPGDEVIPVNTLYGLNQAEGVPGGAAAGALGLGLASGLGVNPAAIANALPSNIGSRIQSFGGALPPQLLSMLTAGGSGGYGAQFASGLRAAAGGERMLSTLADMPRRSANILVQNLGYVPQGSWAEQLQYQPMFPKSSPFKGP